MGGGNPGVLLGGDGVGGVAMFLVPLLLRLDVLVLHLLFSLRYYSKA